MFKKIFSTLIVLLLISSVYGQNDQEVTVNGTEFKIPAKYQGGEFKNDEYHMDNVFSIRCIDDDVAQSIGLWASENKFSEELSIGNHPVRHYCQYNRYVHGNDSHAYFASGKSVYEISWVGEEINSDIENLINNTPASEISDDDFYGALNLSIELYKQDRIDRLNQDSEYNYLEAKYQYLINQQDIPDDTRFKEILYMYYLNR